MLRFAPFPVGDMHIDDLRVALFNYIVAKQVNEQFIVRIEDTDKARNIEGKDTEILQILEKFALPHDRVFHQSENLNIHQTLAIRLLEEGKAFVCTCTPEQLDADLEKSGEKRIAYSYSGRCEEMKSDDLAKLKEDEIPFVIRIKKPNTSIIVRDIIKGDIETTPDEVDSFVILRADNTPTHNFACACDDMLTGIDFIIRGEEHMSSTPRQIHIKELLGYDTRTLYAHLPATLNTSGKKMSKQDDTGSLKWLFSEGFIPDAIINYLLLPGNKTPEEIFTLPDALEWFKLENISKSPVRFDIDKLLFINREHLKQMDDKKLSTLFGFADADIGKSAKIYLEEAGTINGLEVKIKSIFAPKDFDGEWGEQMRVLEKIITNAPMIESFDEFESFLMRESGLKGENFSKPLRILLTGATHGPELSDLYPHIKSYLLEIAS
ncbi:MAG: glutamate--tRNA ligase [Campylobacterota bacterium]|nr:glutamate--tRNA ligase [Campylobacterota bacterium]